jgi:DNA-binding transcriptional LysR family regulator
MELYQLRTFAAVAEEGHLTRAAERLHISQPAVSGQIKALEQQFDVRLFERGPTGMTLTPAGRRLLAHALRVLHAAEELRRAARQLNSDDRIAGELTIGTVSDPDSIRLGELLAAAISRHPQLDLHLQHEMSGAALEGVRDGRLDAAYFFGDAPGAEFSALSLRQFVYRVTAPRAWAPRVESADWADIAALPWVVTPAISTHNRLVTALFAGHGVAPPQRHIEADHESVITSLVASGVGASLMREDVARARAAAGEICIWDRARLRTTLWFVCLAERAGDPLVHALLALVRDVWREKASAEAPA